MRQVFNETISAVPQLPTKQHQVDLAKLVKYPQIERDQGLSYYEKISVRRFCQAQMSPTSLPLEL
jgi:hypothetical protein